MKPYRMPADREWVLLKIVQVESASWNRKIAVEGKVQETELPCLDVHLAHVSTAYGDKPSPYHLRTPLNDVLCAPQRGPEFKDTTSSSLREAVGLVPDAELTPEALLGKNVMAQIIHRTDRVPGEEYTKMFPYVWPHVLSPEGVTIPVTFRDGRVVRAKVTWGTAHNLQAIVPGTKVDVISVELGKQFTVIRVGDEWHDINEV
ncbi:MAG: hypothetical protein IJI97_01525 [Clostridia bacterium]|nr:hypothetical protein [Clostridia bacterium]